MKAQMVFINPVWQRAIPLLVWPALATGFCLAQSPLQQVFHDQAVTLMQQQIGLDTDAPNERNPEGLRIEFQKIDEKQLPDGHSIRYRMLVPHAPDKQGYTLTVWRIGVDMKNTPAPVYTNAKGLLMWHSPSPGEENKDSLGEADEVEIDLKAARGEPIRYLLESRDGLLFIPGTIVPYPVESKEGNCRLEARLGFPEGQGLLVYADGLPPNAQVPLETVSEGEKHSQKMKVDAHGHAVAVVGPTVAGRDNGVVKISVALPGCSVAVEVPWGQGSYRPL